MVRSVYFSFFCLLVSSVSNFCPHTRGVVVVTFLGSAVQSCCGEGGTLQQTSLAVLAVTQPHWVCPCPRPVCFPRLHCSGSRLLCWELSEGAQGCTHFPGLSRSGSGSRVLHKGADLVGPELCAHPRSKHSRPQLKPVTYCLPHPSRSVFWVYNRPSFSDVPCVSSGELISSCNPLGRCRPSRIPRSLG